MVLTLEIVEARGARRPATIRATFRKEGGTIGRASKHTLVLPDETVSGEHATIVYREGAFRLADVGSSNGTFLNSKSQRLVRGQSYTLHHGDRVFIGPYELAVALDEARVPTSDRVNMPPLAESLVPAGVESPNRIDPIEVLFGSPQQAKSPLPSPPPVGPPAPWHEALPPVQNAAPPPSVELVSHGVQQPPRGGGGGAIPTNWLNQTPHEPPLGPPGRSESGRTTPVYVDPNWYQTPPSSPPSPRSSEGPAPPLSAQVRREVASPPASPRREEPATPNQSGRSGVLPPQAAGNLMRGDAPADSSVVPDPFESPVTELPLRTPTAPAPADPIVALFKGAAEDPFSSALPAFHERSGAPNPLAPISAAPVPQDVPAGAAPDSDRARPDSSQTAPPAVDTRAPMPDPRASVPPPPALPAMPRASLPGGAHTVPPTDARSVLAAVLAGAGLPDVPVTDELATTFGQIMKAVVGGLIDTLNSRQAFKEEFRAPTTRIRTVDNNPLKFSVDAQDALKNLLGKRSASYLEPVDAFDDAFADLQEHQMAMLAGIRQAFEQMLQRFDPEGLQRQFDRFGSSRTWLGVATKPAYWDLYCEMYKDWTRDPDRAFRELFGEELGRAYEAQVARLKASRPDKS